MKRVFWLMSAVGLTFGQSSIAQSNSIQITQAGYVNVGSVDNSVDVDDAINRLIVSNQASNSVVSHVYQSAGATQSSNFSSTYQSASSSKLDSGSAPSVAARIASRAAHGSSIGRCALYVRKALQSAGYKFTPQPSAYQYAHGTLASAGFTKISNDNYKPQVGDIAVFNRTAKNPHGHIQIYDGKQWVSDFRQPKFSPYSQHNGYTVWRDARYLDATASTGTMLALNEQ